MAETMAATAKKLGQAGLAQLGRLTRRSRHGESGQGDQRDSPTHKQHLTAEDSSLGLSSEYLRGDASPDLNVGSPRLKSSSMCNVAMMESSHIEQDDIMNLTQQVKSFSDALSLLKELFTTQAPAAECDLHLLAHERLGDVVSILKSVLTDYQSLNSTEVFISASQLISRIKGLDDEGEANLSEENHIICENIDQLALSFSTSVSDYLMGDNSGDITVLPARTKSYEDLAMTLKDALQQENAQFKSAMRLPQNIDEILSQMDIGVDVALQRAKSWAKYAKDVMTYVDRKAHYEAEFAKNLTRLANGMRSAICEEGFLPLQDEYFASLENDLAYAATYQATASALLAHKFIEPLNSRRSDHEKVRKSMKDMWNKEVKRMEQAVNSLKNAKTMYIQRRQEYERASDLSQKAESEMLALSGGTAQSKVEKKKKAEEDAMHKAAEAETTYKACVAEANMRQVEMARVKREVLARLHEQIVFGDKVLKKVTRDYFHIEHTTNAPVPTNYYDLYEKCELYEAGSQYAQFVGHLTPSTLSPVFSEQFIFEPYQSDRNANRKTSNHSTSSLGSTGQSYNNSPQTNKAGHHRPLVRAWSHTMGSDSESASGSSNKSMDSSPSASPLADLKGRHSMSDVLEEDVLNDSGIGTDRSSTKGKRETATGDFVGICKRLGTRRGTFGVDFTEQVRQLQTDVPPIITQCLLEIELRGITTKGIYRVSGVKSKVEALCQKFEMSQGHVDIREDNPVVVSNVLKLYLRQLPEPLLTFALYPDFIRIAKEDMARSVERTVTIERLNDLVSYLPQSNFHTCAVLMHHLKRVTHHIEENQMNANNLGIVFGPTLLRPRIKKHAFSNSEGPQSLTALVDTPHQTSAIELLISAAEEVFGPHENFSLVPMEVKTKQAPLTQTHTDTIETPPLSGHRALRRSSSTPIGEGSMTEFAEKKALEASMSQSDNSHPDTDDDESGGSEASDEWIDALLSNLQDSAGILSLSAEMRDMVTRRLRNAERTKSVDNKSPDSPDQRTRLAKSLEIKAKFLLGADLTATAGQINIDTTDSSVTQPDKSDLLTDPTKTKPARPLSASISEARARYLLGTAADDEKTDSNNEIVRTRSSSAQPDTNTVRNTPALSSPMMARSKNFAPKYHESEASEISMQTLPTSKCILTVPRPYPGLSSSPTPAPKLRLPPGTISPTSSPIMSRTPSPKFTDPSNVEYRSDFMSGNISRMSLIDDKLSDDEISFV